MANSHADERQDELGPPCAEAPRSAATVDVFLRGKSGQTLQGTFEAWRLPQLVEFFCQCEKEAAESPPNDKVSDPATPK